MAVAYIKNLKDSTEQIIYPITKSQAVVVDNTGDKTLDSAIEELNTRIDAIGDIDSDAIAELDNRVDTLETDSASLKTRTQAAENNIVTLNSNVSTLTTKTNILETTYSNIATDVNDLDSRFDNAISAVTVDTELIDIRTGANGNTYSTAGTAVREQIEEITDALKYKYVTWEHTKQHLAYEHKIETIVNKGELYFMSLKSSTGETISGALYGYKSDGSAVNVTGCSTGRTYYKVANNDYVAFGVQLSAPTNPCIVTFRFADTGSALMMQNGLNDYKELLREMFRTNVVTWEQMANVSHPTWADPMTITLNSGDTFYFQVTSSNDMYGVNMSLQAKENLSDSSDDALFTITGLKTGQVYKFTYTPPTKKPNASVHYLGLYMDAMSIFGKVSLVVMRPGTLLKVDLDFDEVPTYWKENIENALDTVAEYQTYNSGITFGYITDIHWETNHHLSPRIINYINHNSRVHMWINGGDLASGDGGNGKKQLRWLCEACGQYESVCDFYSINGNHDGNQMLGGTAIGDAALRNTIMPDKEKVTYGNGLYYWFDYRGTRFVCLDTGTVGNDDPTQIQWAVNVINSSTLPVIIVMHILYDQDGNLCAFYNNLISSIGVNANVKMILCGHQHNDIHFISTTGIPVVVCDTDSRYADDGITRVSGTTTEQCLSIITNDYTNQVIHVTRVGGIKESFDVSYKQNGG